MVYKTENQENYYSVVYVKNAYKNTKIKFLDCQNLYKYVKKVLGVYV